VSASSDPRPGAVGSPATGLGAKILGGAAAFLLLLLAIGFLLPSRWEASASALVPASADEVFPLLDAPEGWRRWTTWPDSGVVREGPDRGAGASMAWSNADVGSGRFTIEEAVPHQRVRYVVNVNEGAMRTEGTLTLRAERGGVRVEWHEEGDLGRNPLMGYWGLFMEEAQAAELAKGLDRLAALVSDSARTR